MRCRAIQGRAECPICRAPLKPGDLFDAATAEEEESQRLLNENIGNYGAKVRAWLPPSHRSLLCCHATIYTTLERVAGYSRWRHQIMRSPKPCYV